MHYLCQECQNSFPAEQLSTIYKQIAGETKSLRVCLDCRDKHEKELEMSRQNFQAQFGEKDTPKHHVCLERDSVTVDIHKIIDDAMEKKDRTVNIYIGESGTSIYVSPRDDEPLAWVPNPKGIGYLCPTCGYWDIDQRPYCSTCGEKLKRLSEEDE